MNFLREFMCKSIGIKVVFSTKIEKQKDQKIQPIGSNIEFLLSDKLSFDFP